MLSEQASVLPDAWAGKMFPGRNSGSRTVQGLTIKAEFAKLSGAAEQQRHRHSQSAVRNWRSKTIQNLAFTIIVTIAATVVLSLALAVPPQPMKWEVVCLAVVATLCTLVIVSRMYPERQAAHVQIARRYSALAESCRMSITKYEEKLIGDSEFQALLEQHIFNWDALQKDTSGR